MMKTGALPSVLGRQIERTRREHKLSVSILAMLSGLGDQQVQSLESGNDEGFVNDAHRVDCARRVAQALGLPRDHFLQQEGADAIVPNSAPESGLAREHWQHLPLASLDVLSSLPACELPPAAEQRRGGSPMLAALALCIVLAGLLLAIAALH